MNRLLLTSSIWLLAVAAAQAQTVIHAQPAIDLHILRQKNVRTELKIDERAGKALDDLLAAEEPKMGIEIQGGADPDQIASQIKEQFASVEKETRAGLQKILSADQYKRFDELNLQALGVHAFQTDRVRTALALTATQKQRADDELSAVEDFMGTLMSTSSPEPGQTVVKFQPSKEQLKQLHEKQQKAVDAVVASLSEDQRKKWAAMLGARFEFDAPRGVAAPDEYRQL